MMRSMAASMGSSSLGDNVDGFEFRDRLVGEPDPVVFAAVKHRDDELEQAIIGGDRVGVADHLDIHHLQTALDQHDLSLRYGGIKRDRWNKFHSGTGFFCSAETKTHRVRKNRTRCALGKRLLDR